MIPQILVLLCVTFSTCVFSFFFFFVLICYSSLCSCVSFCVLVDLLEWEWVYHQSGCCLGFGLGSRNGVVSERQRERYQPRPDSLQLGTRGSDMALPRPCGASIYPEFSHRTQCPSGMLAKKKPTQTLVVVCWIFLVCFFSFLCNDVIACICRVGRQSEERSPSPIALESLIVSLVLQTPSLKHLSVPGFQPTHEVRLS
jgi:hypothetical protein